MKPYVEVWLKEHPERSLRWLETRFSDGFDIHHLDGDHTNNDALNLVLIDCSDHMMLHNGKKRFSRVVGIGTGGGRPKKVKKAEKAPVELESLRRTIEELDRQVFHVEHG